MVGSSWRYDTSFEAHEAANSSSMMSKSLDLRKAG